MSDKESTFFDLAMESKSLLLGDFTLKSGKKSPYFFNVGAFFEHGYIDKLADLYSELILESSISFDVIFGPAYKGIPLAAAISASLAVKTGKPVPFAFDRKEEKKHGEGGQIVGELKNKKILIVDDVLTAGTALKRSIEIIIGAEGSLSACVVALDREEKIEGRIARDRLLEEYKINILSIAQISNLVEYLESSGKLDDAEIIKNHISRS